MCRSQNQELLLISAHPQFNGQAEVAIRTLKAALKTKLEDLKGKWVEYLPEVLWAPITTRKSATLETPCHAPGSRSDTMGGSESKSGA